MYNEIEQQIVNATMANINKAMEMFNIELSMPKITFMSRGLVGATAWRRGEQYGIEFNTQMLKTQEAIDMTINEIVPHEVAHLVCFFKPDLGNNHDRGWKRVCIMLGGNGNRTATIALKRKRQTKVHLYNVNGAIVRLGAIRHNKTQRGITIYRCMKNGIIKADDYTGKTEIQK